MIDDEYYESRAIGASHNQEYFVISNTVSFSLFKTSDLKCLKRFRLYDACKAIFTEDDKYCIVLTFTGNLRKINMRTLKTEYSENKLFDEPSKNVYLISDYLIFAHTKSRGKSILYGQVIQYNYVTNEIIMHDQMENQHITNPIFYTNDICFSVNSRTIGEDRLELKYKLDDKGSLNLINSKGVVKQALDEEEVHETRNGEVECVKYIHDHLEDCEYEEDFVLEFLFTYEVVIKKRGKTIFKLDNIFSCGHIVLGEEDNYILYTDYKKGSKATVNILNLNTLEIEKVDGEISSGLIKPLLLDKKKKVLVNLDGELEKMGELPSGMYLIDFK